MYFRDFCRNDEGQAEAGVHGDCGWFYWDWDIDEFFVTCDEYYDLWEWCW